MIRREMNTNHSRIRSRGILFVIYKSFRCVCVCYAMRVWFVCWCVGNVNDGVVVGGALE